MEKKEKKEGAPEWEMDWEERREWEGVEGGGREKRRWQDRRERSGGGREKSGARRRVRKREGGRARGMG